MDISTLAYERRFGTPIVKDGCGVFGVLRKRGSPPIAETTVVDGISCIRYRGSNLGAGYAAFLWDGTSGRDAESRGDYKIQAFVEDESVADSIRGRMQEKIGSVHHSSIRHFDSERNKLAVWEARIEPRGDVSDELLEHTVDRINASLFGKSDFKGRIFSYGRHLSVYKEVGYPDDVARLWRLSAVQREADLWIAHTRQPTNSPGSLPVFSHPFASMDTAIVHNGDISSFGSNLELLNSWGLRSHTGTDSEVVARLLDRLLRVEGLSVREAAMVLTNPFERNSSEAVTSLLNRYRGARLDGPFAVVAGHAGADDLYLIALTDRSKFRPLLVGEDDGYFYVASEENQIRRQSKNAKIWTPEPGSFFIASLKQGLIEPGTVRDLALQTSTLSLSAPSRIAERPLKRFDAQGRSFHEINEAIESAKARGEPGIMIENCGGQRYIGIGLSTRRTHSQARVVGDDGDPGSGGDRAKRFEETGSFKVQITGFPGNCLANLNEGATFEVYGNAADDLADTMHAGAVVVHGSARDVAAQALQGGSVFIRGSVGNRAAIQMREYERDRPYLIVGETADDYLGEYMAGGVVVVLNLSGSNRPARNYIGTGMVGGRLYIRGKIREDQIGLLPPREDVMRYLQAKVTEGNLAREEYEKVADSSYPSLEVLSRYLPPDVLSRILTLFFTTKYTKPVTVERRRLDEEDIGILDQKIAEFTRAFGLGEATRKMILNSEFTVIRAREESKVASIVKTNEMNVPPQEVPVEE